LSSLIGYFSLHCHQHSGFYPLMASANLIQQ
jgi:hypothetical protein